MDHLPVMPNEVLHSLAIKKNGIYIDGTFGRGGHSQLILNALNAEGFLFAFDRDQTAILSARAQHLRKNNQFTLSHRAFSKMDEVILETGFCGKVNGILLDLGVSSPQLDQDERGFSFMKDGPLDMRMDQTTGLSAAQWLADVDEKTLVNVLFDYGEERFARQIARAIITQRQLRPIESTVQLATLIKEAIPIIDKHKHPATRSFQAIRIIINNELAELTCALAQSLTLLAPQGRLVVISFHSLEDRIVKRFMRNESGVKSNIGKLPIREDAIQKGALKRIGKAIKPSSTEIAQNPRARSAIMRIAERL